MSLPTSWATPEDFATLFQYFWYRNFPIGQNAAGARRLDWTIHIGVVVINIADLMGLIARLKTGKREDAVLRSGESDEIAIEWEWYEDWGKKLERLKRHKVWSKDKTINRSLSYAVFITYAENIQETLDYVSSKWKIAKWPLLLLLVEVANSRKFFSNRQFKKIHTYIFQQNGNYREIRSVPACPWGIIKSRQYVEAK